MATTPMQREKDSALGAAMLSLLEFAELAVGLLIQLETVTIE
jgi:hypothetical protein